jgi:hypothetical protein
MNKFNRWFAQYNKGDNYLQISETLIDSNNISYPISLIIKKTNPYRLEITEEFFRLADGYNAGK